MKRAARIGVTGKMGSGKSTLTEWMAASGMIALRSDSIAKELMVRDPKLKSAIIALLGGNAYSGEDLNRDFVSSRIFSDERLRRKLEAIVHPAVRREIEFVATSAPTEKPVVVESALIFQTDLWKAFDYILLVDASDDVVIERLRQQGKYSTEDIQRRVASQRYNDIRTDEADFVIENNSTPKEFEARSKTVLTILTALLKRDLPELPLHHISENGEE